MVQQPQVQDECNAYCKWQGALKVDNDASSVDAHLLDGVQMGHQVQVQGFGQHKVFVGLQGHVELL